MAWPDLTGLPSNPETLSPNTLREFYENQRAVFLDLVAELGNDPGGSGTVQTRLAAHDTALSVVTATVKTAAYTFALVDANTVVESNLGTALTFTVPPNSSVAFPIGTLIEVHRYGAGSLTIAAGAGVTIRVPTGSPLTLRVQYSSATLRKRATDEWILSGDLG